MSLSLKTAAAAAAEVHLAGIFLVQQLTMNIGNSVI
jgi:hypothetical protein